MAGSCCSGAVTIGSWSRRSQVLGGARQRRRQVHETAHARRMTPGPGKGRRRSREREEPDGAAAARRLDQDPFHVSRSPVAPPVSAISGRGRATAPPSDDQIRYHSGGQWSSSSHHSRSRNGWTFLGVGVMTALSGSGLTRVELTDVRFPPHPGQKLGPAMQLPADPGRNRGRPPGWTRRSAVTPLRSGSGRRGRRPWARTRPSAVLRARTAAARLCGAVIG